MKEVKINKNPIIIENNNFQTIQINVLYPYQKEEKNLAKDIILPSMLMYINNDYPTEKGFSKALKERFILKLHSFPTTIGTTNYLTFSLTIPDKKSLKQDFIEEQIKFLHDTIYNPKIENNGFLPFEVERELKNLKLLIDNINKSFNPYLNYKIKKLVDTEGLLSLNIKDHEEQLKDITPKNLYKYYQEKVINNKPLIFIFGDIKNTNIENIIKKHFPIKEKLTLKTDYTHYLTPQRTIPKEITEEKEWKDSALSFIYKIKDMKKEDNMSIELICLLLSSLSSRLLDKKLRDEYNLVYGTQVTYNLNFGIFIIVAYINKDNKDLAKEKILEVMNELKEKELITPLIEKIKERKRINLIKTLDKKQVLLGDYMYKVLGIDDTNKENYEKLKKLKASDVLELLNRFNLDTIYFLKEQDYE